MEKPESFRKKKAKKIKEPEGVKLINSMGLPHDYFKNYLKLWKPKNKKKKK